jgi:uncharacterized protein (DUF2344 family)
MDDGVLFIREALNSLSTELAIARAQNLSTDQLTEQIKEILIRALEMSISSDELTRHFIRQIQLLKDGIDRQLQQQHQ